MQLYYVIQNNPVIRSRFQQLIEQKKQQAAQQQQQENMKQKLLHEQLQQSPQQSTNPILSPQPPALQSPKVQQASKTKLPQPFQSPYQNIKSQTFPNQHQYIPQQLLQQQQLSQPHKQQQQQPIYLRLSQQQPHQVFHFNGQTILSNVSTSSSVHLANDLVSLVSNTKSSNFASSQTTTLTDQQKLLQLLLNQVIFKYFH